MKYLSAGVRWLTAAAILVAIVWQVQDRLVHNVFRPGEYFAYFTIQSSMIAAMTLAAAGWWRLGGYPETLLLARVRLSVVCYSSVTAIVYNALLRGLPPAAADAGYHWPVIPNEILHVWAPLLIALDFVITASSARLRWRSVFAVLLYPAAWILFSVVRGLATDWWPYWFLNPTEPGGVAGMLTYVVGIAVFMLILGYSYLGLIRLSEKVQTRRL
jgi:hypothetical protein